MSIRLVEVTQALQQYWEAEAPEGLVTQFPGCFLDATALKRWFELWIVATDERPYHDDRRPVLSLFVDVHCFSREDNKQDVLALADHARVQLGRRILPFSEGGRLRLFEPECRELTRRDDRDPRVGLQHLLVSFRGQAECPTTD